MYMLRNKSKILFGMLLAVALVVTTGVFLGHKRMADLLVFYLYGGAILPTDQISPIGSLIFCIPFIFQMLLFGGSLHKDFKLSTAFVFPRTNSCSRWLIKKSLLIELISLLFYIAQFVAVLIYAAMRGYTFDFNNILVACFYLIITMVSINNIFLILTCILSIKKSGHMISILILMFYVSFVYLLPLFIKSGFLMELIPVYKSITILHELPSYLSDGYISSVVSLWGTIAFGVIGRIILYFIGAKWIKKTDLIVE